MVLAALFAQATRRRSLRYGLTLRIEAGSKRWCGWRTGAGKSTLVQTILRLYPVQSGAVFVDSVGVGYCWVEGAPRRVAIVPQAPTLFAGRSASISTCLGKERTGTPKAALELARGRPRGVGLARLAASWPRYQTGRPKLLATCPAKTESRR